MIDFQRAKWRPPPKQQSAIYAEYDAIKSFINAQELVDHLGIKVASYTDTDWTVSCPLPSHGGPDRNPSAGINPELAVLGCFSCGGRSFLTMVKEIEDCSLEEALRIIKMCCPPPEEILRMNVDRILTPAVAKKEIPVYDPSVLDDLVYNQHVANRGLSQETAVALSIGWRKEHHWKHHVGPAIIIPHFWKGDLVGWQARWTTPADGIPKYVNSDDFPRRETLYLFDEVDDAAVVVEAPFTAAWLYQIGIPAVATFGASLTKDQYALLNQIANLWLSFDNDVAGKQALEKSLKSITASLPRVVPFVDQLHGDLADVTVEEAEMLIGAAKTPIEMELGKWHL